MKRPSWTKYIGGYLEEVEKPGKMDDGDIWTPDGLSDDPVSPPGSSDRPDSEAGSERHPSWEESYTWDEETGEFHDRYGNLIG